VVEPVGSLCWHCTKPVLGIPGEVAVCACGAYNRITAAGRKADFEAAPETWAAVDAAGQARARHRRLRWRDRRTRVLAAAGGTVLVALLGYLVAAGLAGNALGDRMRAGDLGGDGEPYTVQYQFASEYAGTRSGVARADPGTGLVAWESGGGKVVTDTRRGLEFWLAGWPGGPAQMYRDYSTRAPMAQLAGRDVDLGFVLCPPQWAMCGDSFSGRVSRGSFTSHLDGQGRVTELHVDDARWGQLHFWYTYGSTAPVVAPESAVRKGVDMKLDLDDGRDLCFLGCRDRPPSATVAAMRHSVKADELELRLGAETCVLHACRLDWRDNDRDGLVSQGDVFVLAGSLPSELALYDRWAQVQVYSYRDSPSPLAAFMALGLLAAAALRRRGVG
jgi:hypothetical protein